MWVGMLGSKVIKGVLLDKTLSQMCRSVLKFVSDRSMESVWEYVQLCIFSRFKELS